MFGRIIKFPIFASMFFVCVLAGEEEDWEMNYARVEEFPCGKPQPRIISLRELNIKKNHDRISPSSTVLHRCESAGYCGNGRCLASNYDYVYVTFARQNSFGRSFFSVRAQNHTSCSCEEDGNLPK